MNDVKKLSARELKKIYKHVEAIELEYCDAYSVFAFGNLNNRFIITPESTARDYIKAAKMFRGYKKMIIRIYNIFDDELIEENEISLNRFIELYRDNKEV